MKINTQLEYVTVTKSGTLEFIKQEFILVIRVQSLA